MLYKESDVQNRIEEHYKIAEDLGYEIIGVFCQGSWNYGAGLCDAESDVDSKCLVLPSFEDFCLGKPLVSTVHVTENNEHIDLKDLRIYMKCFKKQNVNFVEILFTKYKKINPKYEEIFNELIKHREEIAHYDINTAINCMVGMAYEKRKAMCHPYPTLIDKIEKYGYDGKQLSHIERMHYFLEHYINGDPYIDCLEVKDDFASYLLRVKRNKEFSLQEALSKADETLTKMQHLRELHKESSNNVCNDDVSKLLDKVCIDCMKINFISYLTDGD